MFCFRKAPATACAIALVLAAAGIGCAGDSGSGSGGGVPVATVSSAGDYSGPVFGSQSLRQALETIPSGGRVTFDEELNGATITLTEVGEEHSILKGEAYQGPTFLGYIERDYGRSAIYLKKNIMIDASNLPDGITIAWGGGEDDPARVLAVYGDLVMKNVTITGGVSKAEALPGDQPFTLARGGGLATWGTAELENCVFRGNRVEGDLNPARDRGAFGGGIYANLLLLSDCVVSGNSARGYGAAGGGVYTVAGEGMPEEASVFKRSSICGNRVTAQHAYGGGIFSEGGGRGGDNWLEIENCTIARNLAEDNPDLGETGTGPPPPQYYYRGGGVYMTNGSLRVQSCTIAENEVTGVPALFKDKPNLSGGGVAATIGDAHVVEHMSITHSIIVGNKVNGAADDIYTGSLLHFTSGGYNVFGAVDFSEILVPIPTWWSLSRKHYPKVGDIEGQDIGAVLDLTLIGSHPDIKSAGVMPGDSAPLWYPPAGPAVDHIPSNGYELRHLVAQYAVSAGHDDDFLFQVLEVLRYDYGMGPTFGDSLDYAGVTWQGADESWPSDPANDDWIKFWRDLDSLIGDSMGPGILEDDFWSHVGEGPLGPNIYVDITTERSRYALPALDQSGRRRPRGAAGDSGAAEL